MKTIVISPDHTFVINNFLWFSSSPLIRFFFFICGSFFFLLAAVANIFSLLFCFHLVYWVEKALGTKRMNVRLLLFHFFFARLLCMPYDLVSERAVV